MHNYLASSYTTLIYMIMHNNLIDITFQQYHHTYREEQKLNVVLNIFATNYSIVYRGQNTVRSQIGYGSELRKLNKKL